jgi:integrase/recombinase XerC
MKRYLTSEEEKQLLNHIKQFNDIQAQRDHAWMRVARYTGVRVSVLSGMTLADAQKALRTHNLHVRGEINKGGKSYTVHLVKKARIALRDLLRIRTGMGASGNPDTPLIMSRKHGALAVRSFEERMGKWVESAGLTVKASPHWWRHTAAMRIMQCSTSKDPRAVVQQVLGQDSIESTVIYTLPTREQIEQAMEEAS